MSWPARKDNPKGTIPKIPPSEFRSPIGDKSKVGQVPQNKNNNLSASEYEFRLKELTERDEANKTEIECYRKVIRKYDVDLNNATEENKNLKLIKITLEAELKENKNQAEKYKRKYLSSRDDLEITKSKYIELQGIQNLNKFYEQKIASLSSKIECLTLDLTKANEASESLLTQNESLKSEINRLNSKLSICKSKNSELSKELSSKHQEISSLTSKLSETECANNQLIISQEDFQQKIISLSQDLVQSSKAKSELSQELEESTQTNTELKIQISTLRTNNQLFTDKVSELGSKIRSLESVISEKNREIETAKVEIDKLNKIINEEIYRHIDYFKYTSIDVEKRSKETASRLLSAEVLKFDKKNYPPDESLQKLSIELSRLAEENQVLREKINTMILGLI